MKNNSVKLIVQVLQGLLPLDILNMSESDKSAAILVNAFQMLHQFKRKRQLVEETTLCFLYKPYEKLAHGKDEKIAKFLQAQLQKENYDEVVSILKDGYGYNVVFFSTLSSF